METISVDLAWAAGFFDGEGHVRHQPGVTARGTTFRNISITVAQSDRERLDRLATVLGVGHVRGPYAPKGAGKPYHVFAVSGFSAVQQVAAMLWQWLGPAKRAQFGGALTNYRTFETKIAPCPHGHERQKCRTCRSEWTRAGWADRKASK